MMGREYKIRFFKMHLKFKGQQLKTILYIYRALYQNLKVTANQKSVIKMRIGQRDGTLTCEEMRSE